MKETTGKTPFRRVLWRGILLFFVLLLAARAASVAASFFLTDDRYAQTFWSLFMSGAKQLLTVAAFGSGISLLTALSRFGKRSLWRGVGALAGLYFLDAVASVTIDACSGAVEKDLLPIAAIYCGMNWLFHVVLLLFVTALADRGRQRLWRPKRMLLSGALVYMAGRLLLESLYLVQFLVEVEFMPYASEILSIFRAYGEIFLLYGAGGFLSAWLWWAWLFAEKGERRREV